MEIFNVKSRLFNCTYTVILFHKSNNILDAKCCFSDQSFYSFVVKNVIPYNGTHSILQLHRNALQLQSIV